MGLIHVWWWKGSAGVRGREVALHLNNKWGNILNNEKQDDMNVSFTPLHLKARTVSVSDDLRTYGLLLIICIHESQNSWCAPAIEASLHRWSVWTRSRRCICQKGGAAAGLESMAAFPPLIFTRPFLEPKGFHQLTCITAAIEPWGTKSWWFMNDWYTLTEANSRSIFENLCALTCLQHLATFSTQKINSDAQWWHASCRCAAIKP